MSDQPTFNRFRPHPWHGLDPGVAPPERVRAYIEMTPYDLIKYEVDKATGYLRVDRPQRSSSQPPTLYGFIPQTYCGERVGKLSPNATRGDGDPLDICVVSERPITRAEVILDARVVGGLQMVDHDEADDKIIAVLESDAIWADAKDVTDLPAAMIERLEHYFSTYKLVPGKPAAVSIDKVYGRQEAYNVVRAALDDYADSFSIG